MNLDIFHFLLVWLILVRSCMPENDPTREEVGGCLKRGWEGPVHVRGSALPVGSSVRLSVESRNRMFISRFDFGTDTSGTPKSTAQTTS